MKKLIPALAIFAIVTAAHADSNDAIKKQLAKNYKAFSTAFQKKNMDAVAGLMTDDYTVVQQNGKVSNKTQILADFKQESSMMSDAKWDRTIAKLTVNGKQAIALVNGNFLAHMAGQGAQPHEFRLVGITQDTWIKTAKGYKLQKSVVQKSTVTIDGKVMKRPGG